MTKTASEMIFAKYYVIYDEMSETYCIIQETKNKNFDGALMAEYTDRHAAEYICEQLNRHAALEAPE